MYAISRLAINGHESKPLANTFFKQDGGSDHLAIVLPGLSYRCNEPLLWYPSRVLLSLGADILWAEYAYDKVPDWMAANDQAQKTWLFDDASAAFQVVMSRKYERVTIVGKSLGTLAMGHLLTTQKFPESAKAVWLTPVLNDNDLRGQLEAIRLPSLLVIGSKDHYYDEAFLKRLRAKKTVEVQVIEGADHILETKEGVIASVDTLKMVTESVRRFAGQT